MEKGLLRLECLKLVRTHLGPEETIAQAKLFEAYISEHSPSLPVGSMEAEVGNKEAVGNSIPLPKVTEPNDSRKDYKQNNFRR